MSSDVLNWINAIAAVASAIGTVGAVAVALWLARRDERLRLSIFVGTGGVIVQGGPARPVVDTSFGLVIMALLPLSVYTIALTTSLIHEDKALKPIMFALAALLSAELGWQIVRLVHKRRP